MALNLDSYLGISAKALNAEEQRASVLANNLANANTPGFKAQDIDFKEYLASSMAGNLQQLKTTTPNQIGTNSDFSTILKYRTPLYSSLDGNTVDKDVEVAEFAKNALAYQTSLNFLTNKIKYMTMALKGE